jgi:hypothetical protein
MPTTCSQLRYTQGPEKIRLTTLIVAPLKQCSITGGAEVPGKIAMSFPKKEWKILLNSFQEPVCIGV